MSAIATEGLSVHRLATRQGLQDHWNVVATAPNVGDVLTFTGTEWEPSAAVTAASLGIYNVVTYGADPTGTNDSRSAIQAAWDDLIADGGGELFFPPGDYRVDPSGGVGLSFDDGGDNIRITGNGAWLRAQGTYTGYFLRLGDATSTTRTNFLEWRGLKLKNNGATGITTGLELYEVYNCSFFDLIVDSFPNEGMTLNIAGFNNRFWGVTVWSNGGIGIKDNTSGTIHFTPMWWYGCRIESNGEDGLDLNGDQYHFIGCTFQSNATTSASFYDVRVRQKSSYFVNCQFEHADPASAADERTMLFADTAAFVAVNHCVFSGNRTGANGHTGAIFNGKFEIGGNSIFRTMDTGWIGALSSSQGNIGVVFYSSNLTNFDASAMTNYAQFGPQVAPIFRYSAFTLDGGQFIATNGGSGGANRFGADFAKSATLTVGGGVSIQLVLSETVADSTNKNARMGVLPYANNTQAVVALFSTSTTSSTNQLNLGGGTGAMQAATSIFLITAAAVNTATGTNRWEVTANGHFVPLLVGGNPGYDVGASSSRFRAAYGLRVDLQVSSTTTDPDTIFVKRQSDTPAADQADPFMYHDAAGGILARLTYGGTWVAGSFVGDGSGLTDLDAGDITAGTLPIERGGTETTSFTARAVILGGTGAQTALRDVGALGTSGQVLTSNGAGADPTWQNPSAGALTDLTDVTITSPATGHFLRKSAGDWVNVFLVAADLPTHTHAPADVTMAAGFTVVGKSTTGGGAAGEIAASADQVLRRSGSGDLLFGTLVTNNLGANIVTFAKLVQSAAAGLSVVGRSTNTAGDFAEITAGTDGHALRRSGTALGFGTLANGAFADNTIAHARLVDIAQYEFLGRTASGTGAVSAISFSQFIRTAPTGAQTVQAAATGAHTAYQIILRAADASGGTTTVDAPSLKLTGQYWTGSATAEHDWTIINDVTATTPASRLILQNAGTDRTYIHSSGSIEHFSADSTFASAIFYAYAANYSLIVRRAQGSRSSPAALGSGATIGTFAFSGAFNTTPSYYTGADVRAFAAENWSSTNRGAYMAFNITRDAEIALTERLRLEGLGISLLGGAGSYGSGDKVIFIANATTAPSANPTGGGIAYAEGGALKWRGSSGTVTTIAPA